jgi:hypothetical protein
VKVGDACRATAAGATVVTVVAGAVVVVAG